VGAGCAKPLFVSVCLQFIDVCEWFAARSDLILLLFDPYK
jgi:hypothetical protein